MDDSESNNPYLALRAAKIARNEARLRELGLGGSRAPSSNRATAVPARRQSKPEQEVSVEDRPPPRRSKRTKGTSPHYTDTADVSLDLLERRKRTKNEKNATESPSIPKQLPLPAHSARDMNLNVKKLLLGDTEAKEGLLGKCMPKTGKAFVMETSASLAVDNSVSLVSFNKYSGVQEWENCLYLWINLNAPNSEVVNEFPNDGRLVTWFAGSRMHEGSRVIQRLIQVGKQAADPSSSSSSSEGETIVLWCRLYNQSRKTFDPYVCLGRLSYLSHDENSQPLSFVWKLLDFNTLSEHVDKNIREAFSTLVKS